MKKAFQFFVTFTLGVVVMLGFTAPALATAVGVQFDPLGWSVSDPYTVTAAISVELWVNYIVENLFKDNSFATRSFDEGSYVLGGSVVHIPQAGAKPTVVKNRDTFPATAVRRTDTDISYLLDVYQTDPTHIPNAELMEISYDKIGSVLKEHVSALSEHISDELLYKWHASTSANIIRTLGTASASYLPHATATGTRKGFTKESLKAAKFLFNKANIAKEDRVALLPSEFLEQLLDDEDLKKRDSSLELDMKGGVVTRLYGFDIMERSAVLMYDNTSTPVCKATDAEDAAADNLTALCWQKNAVAKAMGTVDFFENLKDALYYGDVYSAEVKMGGRKRRSAGEGVISIVQAHG